MQKSIRMLLVLAGLAFAPLGQPDRAEKVIGTYFAETPGVPPLPFPPPPPPERA